MVSNRHIMEQGPVLAALGRTALLAAGQRFKKKAAGPPELPGPVLEATVQPRSAALVRAYIGEVGGDGRTWKGQVPPHMFPQWGFGLAAGTLKDLPYPLMKVVNGGCRLEINAPLPDDAPLHVSAQLASIDDNGRRAVIEQIVTTGTAEAPDALVARMFPIVVYGGRGEKGAEKGGEKAGERERPSVPLDAVEVTRWKIPASAGLDFARLTGDFNPIHWIPAYARASGFKNTILHGFATLARAYEGLNQNLFAGASPIDTFDVRFTSPLILPANVGLYIRREGGEVFVGDAPGGRVYMMGTYTTRQER